MSVRAGTLATLLATAFLAALLALFQWMELLVANAGGSLACSINATVDCGPVWGSKAARAIGDAAKMPVAALGLVWGLTASALAIALAARATSAITGALRLTAIAGVVSVIALGAISFSLSVVCPTCLATYVLVAIFAVAAFKLPGSMSEGLGPGAGLAIGVAFASYLALLYPAHKSPKSVEASGKKAIEAAPAPGDKLDPIPQILAALPADGKQALSDVMLQYAQAPVIDRGADQPRFHKGPAHAPIELIEWTDVKCGHCALFVVALDDLLVRVPPDLVRVEPRQFPLDKECNKNVSQEYGDGIRCAGARALICLEGSPDAYFDAQRAIFAEQDTLTKEKVLAIAKRHAPDPSKLDACISSPETAKKLEADIALGVKSNLVGTPHVLLNRKLTVPFPPFIYIFMILGGKLEHPALAQLPPGRLD